MIKRISPLLIALAGLAVAGCNTSGGSQEPVAQKLGAGPKDQFECADRNGNDYIDKAELVYLRECGIGEDLKCGDVPEGMETRSAGSNFEGGRRMLEIVDADRDDRISKLEFRAHCNSAGRAQ
ncbi:hypothetical protein RE428_47640 [Marinobacter nanhaiticus D15-8W]|uniref:EF-hand domain-containing protein n=1 Tax=Marinobacter nanhaiticus D15-8W TaxID=626887 RepID=N6WV06_9GAMM|nr:EF-hand domain-containing protein [Marinobacter nanhaiticus]ENO15406.1 EF-hand domain-containing protein [Marinobacter nanhaiticus D15-8W]BES73746.1 hypothetical protein RE428_47640 [Marinobacter nanhaiticus D15-8W]